MALSSANGATAGRWRHASSPAGNKALNSSNRLKILRVDTVDVFRQNGSAAFCDFEISAPSRYE